LPKFAFLLKDFLVELPQEKRKHYTPTLRAQQRSLGWGEEALIQASIKMLGGSW
jgi:hypothetical protein